MKFMCTTSTSSSGDLSIVCAKVFGTYIFSLNLVNTVLFAQNRTIRISELVISHLEVPAARLL